MSKLRLSLLGILIATVGVIGFSSQASALSGSEFQAGRIIDDGIFFHQGELNPGSIQGFLNSKVPVCDTNGTQPRGNTTRAAYGASVGVPPPYTCLKDFRQDTPNRPVEPGLCNGFNGGNKSAAEIIYEVSQSCGVNSKVLLVLLQKEQSLITDDWPWPIQYRSATGYGCPDTAPCDAEYYGFFNQVYSAARQFKRYVRDASFFRYRAYRDNYIQYNPNAACGGTNIFIQNNATAALYNYTPYQPNASALSNLYGSGDSCGAYGNRNFWRMYNDWFGSTYADPYFVSFYSQSSAVSLNPNELKQVFIMYQNYGTAAWFDDTSISRAPAGTKPIHLATSQPLNRHSGFSAGWPSASRPAVNFASVYESDGTTLTSDQHVAQPGQIVKFTFQVQPANWVKAGAYREYFRPVVEGTADGLLNDLGTYLEIDIKPKLAVDWVNQSSSPTIQPSLSSEVSLSFRNSGSVPLYDDMSLTKAPAGTFPMHLATNNPINRLSDFSAGWPSASRPAVNFASVYESDGTTLTSDQHVAQPGQIVKFTFLFNIPAAYPANNYSEYFRPILEGTPDGYLPDIGIYYDVIVPQTAVLTYTPAMPSVPLTANQPGTATFDIKNQGNSTLTADTKIYTSNGTPFKHSLWFSNNIIANTIGGPVPPLGTKSVTLPLLAPDSALQVSQVINIEFRNTDNSVVPQSQTTIPVVILASIYRADFAGQSDYPNLTYGQQRTVYLQYKNTGNQVWYDDASLPSAATRNPYPIHLATSQPLNRGSGFAKNWTNTNRPAVNFTTVYESDGVSLAPNQHVAQPGQIVKFQFEVMPATWVQPGTYREYFQPIAEGTSDGKLNFAGTFQNISVLNPTYTAAYLSQSAYPQLNPGQHTQVYFTYRNIGTAPWFDDTSISQAPSNAYPVHLATSHQLNRTSLFGSAWSNNNRPAVNFTTVYESDGVSLAPNQHVAQPGQIAKFSFMLTTPNGTPINDYREHFQPVAEGSTNGAFNDPWTYLDVRVR